MSARQKLKETAKQKSAKIKSDNKIHQNDMAVGFLSFAFAAVCGVGGAIAMPVLYATNFGVGITMAFTGAALGAVAGFVIPQAINKFTESRSFQYLKPSTYKQAFKKG
jgi:mannose/fructose/N-acetylgalactosamine-specific phosphotransferase system component IID